MDLITFDPKRDKVPEILHTKCLDVKFPLSDEAKTVIEELKRNLVLLASKYGNARGIGLSANQIGAKLSIAVVSFEKETINLINPRIIGESNHRIFSRIGCLSFFKYRGMVRHPKEIEISFEDIDGKKHTRKFNGDKGLAVFHEIDHLNGVTLIERSESGIFIPWEKIYPRGSKIAFKNYGIVFAIRKYLFDCGISFFLQPQTSVQYYSQFFKEKINNPSLYISHSVKKRKEMIDLIKKYTPKGGKILEAGCGTSSHSIYLSKKFYDVTAIDIEKDMLEVAKKFNKKALGKVTYFLGNIFHLPFEENSYNTVFSHGVLEHFSVEKIISAVNESLRVANTVVISVPTIFNVSNNLMGDEILRSVFKWKRILTKTRGHLKETRGSFSSPSRLKNLQDTSGGILNYVAPVVVFVVTKE
jgi:peptide deformylase